MTKEQKILRAKRGHKYFHTGVIFLRLPGASLQTKIEHLDAVLDDHADELAHGKFIVVAPGQVRVATGPD